MTQAMKCRYLEGICDLHDTGHEANGQDFPNYYARKMFNDDTQHVPHATQGSQKDSVHQRTSIIFLCHSSTFKDIPAEGL